LNLKPGQTPDISVRENGLVGPEVPPIVHGASTFYNPETVNLTGDVWKVERAAAEATPGLGVLEDGEDAVPPGRNPPGHNSIYPMIGMKPETFIQLFKGLMWRYVYRKKTSFPVNIS